jgi:hypothetical protein
LVGALAYYIPTINDKNNTISSYDSQVSHLESNVTNLQSWLNGNETLLGQTQTWLSGNTTAYDAYVADHNNTNEDYSNLQNQVTQLQSWLDGNISYYTTKVIGLQNQVTFYSAIANLNQSNVGIDNKTVSEPAGGLGISWYDWKFGAYYAGYLSIDVLSATSATWTHVVYSAYGVNYNVQTNVGTSGIAYFPILPSTNITVGVGNGNAMSGATQTVTITYYY